MTRDKIIKDEVLSDIVIKNMPKEIYLNMGDLYTEIKQEYNFNDLDDITWCDDKVSDVNIKYILDDEVKESLQNQEAELRAEYQKKISEINLEHDSRVCENCYHNEYCSILQTAFDFDYDVKNLADFGCNIFKRKQ